MRTYRLCACIGHCLMPLMCSIVVSSSTGLMFLFSFYIVCYFSVVWVFSVERGNAAPRVLCGAETYTPPLSPHPWPPCSVGLGSVEFSWIKVGSGCLGLVWFSLAAVVLRIASKSASHLLSCCSCANVGVTAESYRVCTTSF